MGDGRMHVDLEALTGRSARQARCADGLRACASRLTGTPLGSWWRDGRVVPVDVGPLADTLTGAAAVLDTLSAAALRQGAVLDDADLDAARLLGGVRPLGGTP